jgi:hypothetical protein
MEAGYVVAAMFGQGKAVDYVAHSTQGPHTAEGCQQDLASKVILRMVELNSVSQ